MDNEPSKSFVDTYHVRRVEKCCGTCRFICRTYEDAYCLNKHRGDYDNFYADFDKDMQDEGYVCDLWEGPTTNRRGGAMRNGLTPRKATEEFETPRAICDKMLMSDNAEIKELGLRLSAAIEREREERDQDSRWSTYTDPSTYTPSLTPLKTYGWRPHPPINWDGSPAIYCGTATTASRENNDATEEHP